MIYYPLSVLILSGIREILIISTPEDLPNFKRLLGDGKDLGISLCYKVQPSPDGLAQAFIIGEEFIANDDVCMILGDNIFNGHGFSELLLKAVNNVQEHKKATVFGYYMRDAKRYGVVEFSEKGEVLSIEEKPANPKGNHAVVGLYYYPNSVVNIAKKVTPSKRGELEITTINNEYLKRGELVVELMGRGFTWLDTGTHDSLIEASNYIKTIEARQGFKVACLEVIACQMGYISKDQLIKLAEPFGNSSYGKYLIQHSKEFLMKFKRLDIPDIILCEPTIHNDERGYFSEIFKQNELESFLGRSVNFCQENETKSSYGVLRGLHYQLNPYSQAKLVRVTEGAVLDVVVDLRKNSSTFGKHIAIELSSDNKKQLFIPEGFAHGFIVLKDETKFLYKINNSYFPESEKRYCFLRSSVRD